jgi:hypothetical protein
LHPDVNANPNTTIVNTAALIAFIVTSLLNFLEVFARLEPHFVPVPAHQKFRLDTTPAHRPLSNPNQEVHLYRRYISKIDCHPERRMARFLRHS